MKSKFKKGDSGKTRMGLLPVVALKGIAEIFTFGAKKYSDYNYMEGCNWSRYYDAMQRHLADWFSGEENDSESGKNHLFHAGCCLMILIALQVYGRGKDDRQKFKNK